MEEPDYQHDEYNIIIFIIIIVMISVGVFLYKTNKDAETEIKKYDENTNNPVIKNYVEKNKLEDGVKVYGDVNNKEIYELKKQ